MRAPAKACEGGGLDRCRRHTITYFGGEALETHGATPAHCGDGRSDQVNTNQIGHRRGQPVIDAAEPDDMPALRAIDAKLDGRREKLRNPHDETTLAWFAWIVARLG